MSRMDAEDPLISMETGSGLEAEEEGIISRSWRSRYNHLRNDPLRGSIPMDQCLTALKREFSQEPYAQLLGIEIIELEAGHYPEDEDEESMSNLFGTVHGAAIYSLLDAAFELTVNSHGTVAVALG